MAQVRRHVGRVVFTSREEWIVLTLQCHVDNVVRLVELWDAEKAYLNAPSLAQTRDWTIMAARIHDMAKPTHFQLTYSSFRNKSPEWGYSFAGHRFAVEHENLYVELLGKLHHEYSVEGVTKAVSQLQMRGFNSNVAKRLLLDLYTLEMADQIEATVARAAVGAADPEERVFMDFVFMTKDKASAAYYIDPFPFTQNLVELKIEYVTLAPPEEKIRSVENADLAERGKLLRDIQNWLEADLQNAQLRTREVTLWPWI